MSSKRIRGVLFKVCPQDHYPLHVHARYGQTAAIIEFDGEGYARLANRQNAVIPLSARRSDVHHILRIATANFAELVELWESMQS